MTTRVASCLRLIGVLVAASVLARPSDSFAGPVLRAADIRITVTSPTSCEVTLGLTVDAGNPEGLPSQEIDHRVEAFDGSRVDLMAMRGAQQVGDPSLIGRTRSLVLRPDQSAYEFRYRAQQPEGRAYRCPIWLPAVPTDGQSRAVRLQVELPPATSSDSSMPAFSWVGGRGSTTLGHVPAFVHVSFGPENEGRGWDIAGVMDAVAVAVFLAASAIWAWRRRR